MAKNTTGTAVGMKAETAVAEMPEKETAVVKAEKKETAVVEKPKKETRVAKSEKKETRVAKTVKKETAVVKKEKKETAVVAKKKAEPEKSGAAKPRAKKAAVKKQLSYMDVVEETRKRLMPVDVSGIAERLAWQINVTGEGSGVFYIEVLDGNLYVEPFDYYDREAELIIDSADLILLLNKKLTFDQALSDGKLRMEGNGDRNEELKSIFEQI